MGNLVIDSWDDDHNDEVWLDISQFKYFWYEQGSLDEKLSNWGKLHPSSIVEANVWIESDITPTQYNALSGTNEGESQNISAGQDWTTEIQGQLLLLDINESSKKSLNQDIYKLKLPSHLRPDLVAEVSGKILDNNGAPIDANIRWEDLESGEIIGLSKSDPDDGSYFIVLPMGKIYGYYIEDGSYFPLSNNLDLRKTNKALSKKEDIKVFTFKEMIENGIAVPMNNLFFSPLKYNLLNLSKNELSRISKIIKKYDLKVEISGHTDNVGEDDENQILSEKRAFSVKNYLISKGCDPNKLISVGFGESKPVDDNNTESGKSKNRRVELRFIED